MRAFSFVDEIRAEAKKLLDNPMIGIQKKHMIKRLYEIIEPADNSDIVSKIYDLFMILIIFISIIPLAFKPETVIFILIDKVCVIIFIVEYILRLITARIKLNKGLTSFFIYPFTTWALIDLISILPSFSIVNNGFRVLRVMRMIRCMRVFRAFKILRYSRNFEIIIIVFKKQKGLLFAVGVLAIGYIFISALVIFNVEPDSFKTFFEAIYWATVSLTTMGYGDIYPVTTLGRIITMISAIFGIAIIALPAGIITGGYIDESNNIK